MELALNLQIIEGKTLSTDKEMKWKRFAFYNKYQDRYVKLKEVIQVNLQDKENEFELIKQTTNQAYLFSKKLNKTYIVKI
jgi:hypothetical protein